jgi:hypothetical protein
MTGTKKSSDLCFHCNTQLVEVNILSNLPLLQTVPTFPSLKEGMLDNKLDTLDNKLDKMDNETHFRRWAVELLNYEIGRRKNSSYGHKKAGYTVTLLMEFSVVFPIVFLPLLPEQQ